MDEYKCSMNYACSQFFRIKALEKYHPILPPNICITLKCGIKFNMDTARVLKYMDKWNESNYETYKFPISTIYSNSMTAHIAVFSAFFEAFFLAAHIIQFLCL